MPSAPKGIGRAAAYQPVINWDLAEPLLLDLESDVVG
jgi:hypothetical protein